jgi:hypothetical protein
MSRAQKSVRLIATNFVAYAFLALTAISCSGGGGDDALGPEDIIGLRFLSQPNSLGAGETFTVSVELVAKGDKRVTAATDMVTLAVGGGATLGGTTSVAAVAGVATFTNLTITRAGSNLQLTATARGFSNTSGTLAVSPGAVSAAQSTVTLNPATLNLNVSTNATFTFKDAYGNPLGGLAVSLSSTLTGVTFTPSSGTSNPDGTFATSIRATTGGSAVLSANVGGVSINIGSPMTVFAGAVSLRFVTQPAGVVAGQAFSVSVELLDGASQRVTTATNQISLSANGGLVLSGATSVAAVAGLVTFTGISATVATAGVLLTASGSGLSVQSTAFTIAAGSPSLGQSTLAFPGTLTVGLASTGTFTIKDSFGNPIAAGTIALTSSLAGTTFNPASGTTNASGVFTSSINAGLAGAGTITATVNGTALAFPVAPIAPLPCTIGTLTLGTPVNGSVVVAGNGCVFNNHPAATYRFTVPASATSTVVTVTAVGQGSFFPELLVTPEPVPTTGTLGIGNTSSTLTRGPIDWLLPSGSSFLVSISSGNGSAGSFALTAANSGLGGPGCTTRIILNVNGTYTGQTLSATDDCTDAAGPYYYDVFEINDSRPCTITMRSTAFDTYIELYEASANPGFITNDHGSAGGNDSRLVLTGCRTQNFALLLVPSSWVESITGAYTLQVAFTGGSIQAGLVSAIAARINDGAIVRPRLIPRRQR